MADSVALDPVDLHILRLLQNDARTTYRELAAEVGVAPSTCLDRVTRLRRSGVILGHQLRLDPARLGRGLEALLSVQVRPHRREPSSARSSNASGHCRSPVRSSI